MRHRITRRLHKLRTKSIRQRGGANLQTAIKENNFAQVDTLVKSAETVDPNMLVLALNNARPTYNQLLAERVANANSQIRPELSDEEEAVINRKFEESDTFKIIKLLLTRVNPDSSLFMTTTVPAVFKLLLSDKRLDPPPELLFAVIKEDEDALLNLLLDDPRIDPAMRDNEALFVAEKEDSFECFKLLVEDDRTNPGARDNKLIQLLVQYDFQERMWTDYVELLLESPKVDPAVNDHYVLRKISEKYLEATTQEQDPHEYTNVIILLLSRLPDNIDYKLLFEILSVALNMDVPDVLSSLVKKSSIMEYLSTENWIMKQVCRGVYSEDVTQIMTSAVPNYCEQYGIEANSESSTNQTIQTIQTIQEGENFTPEIEEVSVTYENQVAHDHLEMEDKTLLTLLCNRGNLLVKSSSTFLVFYRRQIDQEMKDGSNIRYECTRKLDGAPVKADLNMDVEYVLLRGGATFLVRLDEIVTAMAKYAIIEVVDSGKKLQYTASRKTLLNIGQNVDITSADHCQDGTDKRVYSVRGVVLKEP